MKKKRSNMETPNAIEMVLASYTRFFVFYIHDKMKM